MSQREVIRPAYGKPQAEVVLGCSFLWFWSQRLASSLLFYFYFILFYFEDRMINFWVLSKDMDRHGHDHRHQMPIIRL